MQKNLNICLMASCPSSSYMTSYVIKFMRLRIKKYAESTLTKTNSSSVCIFPTITRGVSTTSPKMHLGEKQEIIGQLTMPIRRDTGSSPINCYTTTFINQVCTVIVADVFFAVVWEKGKIGIWICITISEFHTYTV